MLITIFTPSYNRAHTLPKLYDSLINQTNKNFIWFVVDDGSTDFTNDLFSKWLKNSPFKIIYERTKNGGKPCAINYAMKRITSPYVFIVDSDDYLVNDLVDFLFQKLQYLENRPDLLGIGVLRGKDVNTPFSNVTFAESVEATNLERSLYALNVDCNELYRVDILKKFPFKVWDGETFAPEEISLNEIAMHGYKLIWYNKIGVISKYLKDGLTRGSWNLQKNNPMGYAMLYNHKLKYQNSCREIIYNNVQYIAMTLLGKKIQYLCKSNTPFWTLLCLPLGVILAVRRKIQFYVCHYKYSK